MVTVVLYYNMYVFRSIRGKKCYYITIVIADRRYDCLGGGARRVRRAKMILLSLDRRKNRVRRETHACRNAKKI